MLIYLNNNELQMFVKHSSLVCFNIFMNCYSKVMCMVGKDKGRIGTVAVVYRSTNEVVVENINVVSITCGSYLNQCQMENKIKV